MPVLYEHINDFAKIAIWHIAEEKKFFLQKVPLQREITHPHKQLQHLAGRYLLQHLYPDFPYHLIEIADTRKPFLPDEEYHFSISHCGDYAAVIVSKDHRVGIDIEIVTPKIERVKDKFLNEEELSWIAGCQLPDDGQSVNQLTLLWSCKEAIFKWYGSAEVDFKKDIHLKPFDISAEGIINCEFVKDAKVSLIIEYKFFDGFRLAWVIN
ncbi:MAG: 4'-phosphopantetheinyl transferase superfamily protein [Chitinophagaceae bacterium]|nr:4'-phosphopantetheinyl transferase superfamily protein [Chitinophagaceae bacterium]